MEHCEDEEEMDTAEVSSSGSESESEEAEDARTEEEQKALWRRVEELRAQVSENSLFYDGHVSLIGTLRELYELEEARKAREQMSEVYPLTPELWLQWIQDEQKVCATDQERQYIVSLFERAVKDYTSVQVWVEYVMFMLGGGDLEATRQVGERALTAAGTHVAEGVLVWQVVMLVEKQVYSGLQKPGAVLSDKETADLEKQLGRIQALYRRQMRVPLMNCGPEALQEEASEFFDDLGPQMKEDLKKTQQRLNEKLAYEDELLRAQTEADKLAAYRAYIAATKSSDNPSAVQSLYERAVLELCLVPDLWEEYVTYAMNQFPGLGYVVLPVCQRSQRNCPWSAALCELHIAALQMFTAEGEEKDAADKIKKALEKGLGCGLQVGGDATRMWMAYLIYLRRQITWSQPHAQELSAFREAAQQAITTIDKFFGEEGDVESLIPRFLARIEAEFVGDCERAREVWNDVIMKRNNNFKNADLWLEFINTERSYGSDKHCRKLCRRALERVWEGVEAIGLAYLRFEQEAGSLETMQEFKKRLEDRMAIVNKKRAEDAAKLEAETAAEEERKGSKGARQRDRKARQGGREGKDLNQNGTSQDGKVFKVPHPVSKPSKGAKRDTESSSPTKNSGPESPIGTPKNIPPPPGFKNSTDAKVKPASRHEGEIEPPPGFKGDAPKKGTKRRGEETDDERAKRLKVEKQHGVLTKESPLDEMCTLFISNLDFKTTEEEVVALFRSCGDISDFRLVKNFKCLSKGFGYLVFKSHEAAVKGLDMDRTPLNGRPVFVSPYDPENHTHKFKYSTGLEKNKLFVSGLPLSMSESDVKAVFEPHGAVKSIRLVTYRNGHSKGLCYLEYHDAHTAAKAVEAMNGSELQDKTISVQISNPSAKKPSETVAPKPVVLGDSARQKKAAGGRGKGMFSLVPRSLRQPPPPSTATATTTSAADPSEKPTKQMSNSDFRSLLMK